MRLGRLAVVFLIAAPLLSGCKGFWDPLPSSTSSTGCATNCTTASSNAFYILNAPSTGTPQIVGDQIQSGKLASITGSPWTVTGTPYAMAMAPTGNFLYVSTTAGVYVYPISGGALGAATQVSQDQAALAIAVDTSGTWLMEALQATGGITIAAVPLKTSTGGINGAEVTTTATVANAAVQNGKMVISSDDKYVFVALGTGGTAIVPFAASTAAGSNPFSGTVYTVPVAKTGGSALSVAVDPTLRLFYIGETLANTAGTSGGLRAIVYSTIGGTLTQASNSPIASGGLAPNSILPVGSSYVYVANGAGTTTAGNIAQFTVTSSSGNYSIAAGTTTASGIQPYSLAEDASNTFVVAVNSLGSPYFSSYTFNGTTLGKLDAQIFTNTGTSPISIVALP